MRGSQKIFTLLRIQFESANQKKLIFDRYQSYKRRECVRDIQVSKGNSLLIERFFCAVYDYENRG